MKTIGDYKYNPLDYKKDGWTWDYNSYRDPTMQEFHDYRKMWNEYVSSKVSFRFWNLTLESHG